MSRRRSIVLLKKGDIAETAITWHTGTFFWQEDCKKFDNHMKLNRLRNNLILIALILLLSSQIFYAQEFNNSEEQDVLETFEFFFNSMRKRDTLNLKTVIYHPRSTRYFFGTFTGTDVRLKGSSSSTVDSFLKSVAVEDGFVGKCRNEFENITIQVYHRYATISANYQCFIGFDEPENQGIYTIQLLKRDDWKIRSISRYINRDK